MAKAKSTSEKLVKSKLIKEIEEVHQDLNWLLSALKGHGSPKQEELQDYRDRFYTLINKKK